MSLSREERETGIIWNDLDSLATVWTTSPIVRARFEKRLGMTAVLDPNGAWSWTVSKASIRISRPRKGKPASPAQLAALSKARQNRAQP